MRRPLNCPPVRRLACLRPLGLTAAAAMAGLLLAGCNHPGRSALGTLTAEPYEARNVFAAATLPDDLVRVAVLPVWSSGDEKVAARIDPVILSELRGQRLFEVRAVERREIKDAFGQRQLSSTERLPEDLLDWIAERTGAQAVILTDLTAYEAYRPIRIGLRSRLVLLGTGQTLWAFNTLFDAGSPAIAAAAREYHLAEHYLPYPLDNAESVLQSPDRFTHYAASTAFATLPPRDPESNY